MTIGCPNPDDEFLQVTSDEMLIIIPKLKQIFILTKLYWLLIPVFADFRMSARQWSLFLNLWILDTSNLWTPALLKRFVRGSMGGFVGVLDLFLSALVLYRAPCATERELAAYLLSLPITRWLWHRSLLFQKRRWGRKNDCGLIS